MAQDGTKEFALLVVGIFFGVIPWLLDKLGIEMPRTFYRALLCISIGMVWWSLVSLGYLDMVPPLKSKDISLGTAIISAVALMCVWLVIRPNIAQKPKLKSSGVVRTLLRLQFFGDYRYPTALHEENIYGWRALFTKFTIFDPAGNGDTPVGSMTCWTIVILFTQPVTYRELNVWFSAAGLPTHEAKVVDQRYVVININGDVPVGALEIHAKP